MIRDEFKNDSKKQTEAKIKQKKLENGGREYYAKKISKLNELFSPVKFSTIFCTIGFSILGVIYALILILNPATKMDWSGWVSLIGAALSIIWCVVWFAILAPHLRRRVAYYKEELAKINAQYVERYRKSVGR